MSSLRLCRGVHFFCLRPSPYTYAPSKRRWLPLLAAFGCGAVCVLARSVGPLSVKPPLRVYASPERSRCRTAPSSRSRDHGRGSCRPKLRRAVPLTHQRTSRRFRPRSKIIAEPIDAAQSRQLAAKGLATHNHKRSRAKAMRAPPGHGATATATPQTGNSLLDGALFLCLSVSLFRNPSRTRLSHTGAAVG